MDAALLLGAGECVGGYGWTDRGSAPLLGGKKGKIKGSGGCLLPTGAAAERGGSSTVRRLCAPQPGPLGSDPPLTHALKAKRRPWLSLPRAASPSGDNGSGGLRSSCGHCNPSRGLFCSSVSLLGSGLPLAGRSLCYPSSRIRGDPRKSCGDCLHGKDGCLRREGAFWFTSRNPEAEKGFALTDEGFTLCWGMERGLSFSPGEAEL